MVRKTINFAHSLSHMHVIQKEREDKYLKWVFIPAVLLKISTLISKHAKIKLLAWNIFWRWAFITALSYIKNVVVNSDSSISAQYTCTVRYCGVPVCVRQRGRVKPQGDGECQRGVWNPENNPDCVHTQKKDASSEQSSLLMDSDECSLSHQ